jgi:transposase
MKSEQRQRVFAERYLAGETLQQIADDYGLTRERVRQVLRRIGVPSLGHRPEHCRKAHELTFAERRAAKLYETGTAPKDILAQTGLTHTQLRTSVLRSGFALKPHGHWLKKPNDAEITAEVCRLYREGLPIKEIVAAIPDVRFAETIYRYLKKGGIEPRRRSTKKCALEARAHEIIAAYRGGATYAEVAERFGASAVGIGSLIRRHGANLTPAEARERLVERVRESNRRRAVQSRIAA